VTLLTPVCQPTRCCSLNPCITLASVLVQLCVSIRKSGTEASLTIQRVRKLSSLCTDSQLVHPEASTLPCPGFCSNYNHLVGCRLRRESQHRQLNGHHFNSHPLNVTLQIVAQHYLGSFTTYSLEVLMIVNTLSCILLTQERNFNRVSYAVYTDKTLNAPIIIFQAL